MGEKRTYLAPGERLYFPNGVCIEIEEIVGSGGTALTYYGKELVEDQEPVRVLLKELYPNMMDFARDAEGRIVAEHSEAGRVYDALTDALYVEQELGNQIVQEKLVGLYPMKQVVQERRTGNFYGLFYQCPSSVSLRTFVEKAGSKMSLWGKLKVIQALCKLVRTMHEQCRYCHNDISGGNVLLISNALLQKGYVDWNAVEREVQVGLIDFACAARLNRRGEAELPEADEPMRFHTEGFSAPELYESGSRHVTVQADVYSVAACLWYLLTGEILETEDGYPVLGQREWKWLETCLRRHELCSLSGDVRAAFGKNPHPISDDVVDKMKSLLEHGLAESWNRFRNMAIFEDRLQEILDLAEGSSVSDTILEQQLRSAFSENRKKLRNRYEIRELMLPVAEDFGSREVNALLEHFLADESVYAIGPGGVGKTTTMFRAAELLYEDEKDVIPVYLELNRLPMWNAESGVDSRTYWMGTEDRPMFIEQYLAGMYYGCHGKLSDRNDLAAGALRMQIEKSAPDRKRYRIFVDGLNEMAFSNHEEKQAFAAAINWYLTYGENLSLVLTSRYDEGLIDSEHIQRVQVSGLTEEAVANCLREERDRGSISYVDYGKIMKTERNSNLWKCLRLPLFLSMYCRIEDKRKIQSAGEILQAYFRGNDKALDGSLQYSEASISEEKYRGMQFAEGLSVENARKVMIDFLLPGLGYYMMYHQIFFLQKEDAERRIRGLLKEGLEQAAAERFGYRFDIDRALEILKEAGEEKILIFICENMGMLTRESGDGYFFPHQYYRDYFAANMVIRMFCVMAEFMKTSPMDYGLSLILQEMMSYFGMIDIPESVLMLCGECLGVHRTVPEYGDNGWKIPEPWDPLVDSMLELRRLMEKDDSELSDEQRKIKHDFIPRTRKLKYNLYQMFCLCRKYGKRADLSGIDFSGISLENCPVEDVIFSHPDEERGIYADLTGTGLAARSFYSYLNSIQEDAHRKLLIHPEGSWVLVMKEQDLLMRKGLVWNVYKQGTRTLLEEHEILGDEIRPIGYMDEIAWASYKEDGRLLALVETVTNVSIDAVEFRDESDFYDLFSFDEENHHAFRKVHFYDRTSGKRDSVRLECSKEESLESLSVGAVLHAAWCGDSFVLLQATRENQLVHTKIWLEGEKLMQRHEIIDMQTAMRDGRFVILDEDRILIHYPNRGVIYRVSTAESTWFAAQAEWLFCVVDHRENKAYIACADGTVVSMDTTNGEMETKRSAGIFRKIESMQLYGDKIYFISDEHLYQTDKTFQDIRYIREVAAAPGAMLERLMVWERRLSIGGNCAAVDGEMIIRLSDGKVVKSWDMSEVRHKLPIRIWMHPKKDKVRISVLEQKENVLYQLGLDENQNLGHVGYRFIELGKKPIYAIHVDSERALMTACTHKRIITYDLNTGKQRPEVAELPTELGIVKRAEFAPDGNSLELTMVSTREDGMRLIREERLVFLNWEKGILQIRPNTDAQGKILRYEFTAEDISTGADSGQRNPIHEHSADWKERRSQMQMEKMDREFYDEEMELPRWAERIRKLLGDKKQDSEFDGLKLFEQEGGWCGTDNRGYLYWDEKRKQKYIIKDEPKELKYFHLSDSQIFAFEDGFLIVQDEPYFIQYEENQKTKRMMRFQWDHWPTRFFLGCPGIEESQNFLIDEDWFDEDDL